MTKLLEISDNRPIPLTKKAKYGSVVKTLFALQIGQSFEHLNNANGSISLLRKTNPERKFLSKLDEITGLFIIWRIE